MITQLYEFSVGSYVVADEWNANFRVLNEYCIAHKISIEDAYNEVAFPTSDLTQVFNTIKAWANVNTNASYDSVFAKRNFEIYVGPVPPQTQVQIYIESDKMTNGECRIIFTLPELMTSDAPILVYYKGVAVTTLKDKNGDCYIDAGAYPYYNAGTYYVMIHELNGKAQVKLISTGV